MRRWMLMAAALLAACGPADEPAADAARADSVAVADSAAAAAPLAADTPAPRVPTTPPVNLPQPDTGYTPWRALEMPSEPWTQSAASAEALLAKVRDVVAAQLEEPDASVLPTRMQSQAADSAVGILVHPDQQDDSVRDVEFRLHLRRQGAEWAVVGVERRERCRRGVAEGGLCA